MSKETRSFNLRFRLRFVVTCLILGIFIISNLTAGMSIAFAQETTPRRAYMASLEGSVLVQAAGQATALPARRNMEIKTGDRIITGRDGKCEIRYDDGSVSRIGPNSRVDITNLSRAGADGPDSTIMSAQRGSVWNNAKDVVQRNSRFEVNTPAAVAGVRGTSFYTRVQPGGDTIFRTYEGLIGVGPPGPDTEPDDPDDPPPPPPPPPPGIPVGGGQQLGAAPDEPLPPDPDPIDFDDIDDFELTSLAEDDPDAFVDLVEEAANQSKTDFLEKVNNVVEQNESVQQSLGDKLDTVRQATGQATQPPPPPPDDDSPPPDDTPAVVSVTGISVDPAEMDLGYNIDDQETVHPGKRKITATISPENATNKNIAWSSSNEAVATVDSQGVVSGITAGQTMITATTQDGGFTADTAVTIHEVVATVEDLEKNHYDAGDDYFEFTVKGLPVNADVVISMPVFVGDGNGENGGPWISNLNVLSTMTEGRWVGSTDAEGEVTVSGTVVEDLPGGDLHITIPYYGYNIDNTIPLEKESTPVRVGPSLPLSSVSISGTAAVDSILTANILPSEATVNYQWQKAETSEGTYTDIIGANSGSYTVGEADTGKYIRVRATGTGNYTGTVTSSAVGPVLFGAEKTETGSLYLWPYEAESGDNIDLELYYELGEFINSGTIVINLPGGFAADTGDQYQIQGEGSGELTYLTAGQISDGGQTITISPININPSDPDWQELVIFLNSKIVPATGSYTFSVIAQTNGKAFSDPATDTFEATGDEPEFAGGDGSAGNPYQIATSEHLNNVRNYMDAHFVLIDHIDLTDYLSPGGDGHNEGDGWEPIGTYVSFNNPENDPFTGTFNGFFDDTAYTISGLSIDREEENCVGLFGFTGTSAKLSNITLFANSVAGGNYVGILVGTNYGEVENCHVSGSVSGDFVTGGLLGENMGPVSDSSSEANVDGNDQVGGLIGTGYAGGDIDGCYATGNVEGLDYVGGLIGFIWDGVNVTGSFATGNVSGGEGVSTGGLAGQNEGTIADCYATGSVTGYENVGGLVGKNEEYTTIARSYSTGDVSGMTAVGGLVGISEGNSAITNCYTMGSVQGMSEIGGLIGMNLSEITNCYAVGSVAVGELNYGGLIGSNDGTVNNSYYNTETTGRDDSSGGEPRTTVQMEFPYDLGNEPGIGDSWSVYWEGQDTASGEDGWGIGTEYNVGSAVAHNGTRYVCIAKHWSSSDSTYNGWDFTDVWQIDEETMPDGVHFFPYLIDNLPVPLQLP